MNPTSTLSASSSDSLPWIIAIIIVLGAFGGVVSIALEKDVDGTIWDNWTQILFKALLGICAAALAPLLLYFAHSAIWDDLVKPNAGMKEYLVFAGTCLVAGLTAKKFIATVSDRIQKQLDETDRKASVALAKAKTAEVESDEAKTTSAKALIGLVDFAQASTTGTIMPPRSEPRTLRADVSDLIANDPEDPNKGKFGGKREVNGRRLDATVEEVWSGWFRVRLSVVTTDLTRPLEGEVTFHLHPTFDKPEMKARAIDGVARLTVYAVGAFTVGAVADGGKTSLELNLATEIDAPKEFREN